MSETLVAQVSTKTAHTLLAEIDGECGNGHVGCNEIVNIQRGPFGAFSVLDPTIEHVDSPDVSSFIDDFLNKFDGLSAPENLQQHIETHDDTVWLNESEEDELASFLGQQTDSLSRYAAPGPNTSVRHNGETAGMPVQVLEVSSALGSQRRAIMASFIPRGLANFDVLREAPALLRYYSNVVIALLTPFKHGKTPWHVLFLPLAKDTLASLSMREAQDDASLGAFYGTLSLSALHRHAETRDLQWLYQVDTFKSMAREHMDHVYSKAYDRPKAFKYKTTIIALLTMAQLSIAEGSREQTERVLIETEKFIRLRGLTRPHKSRKVRLLHHCYAYMRIFHESLSMSSKPSSERAWARRVIDDGGGLVIGQDDPSFRLTAWDNLDEKLREIKSREVGENDLHLASPGLWTSTLYPEIWGIPETWMTLLSQTIRLGNEKDLAESSSTAATLSLREFSQRAKALEKCVLHWEGPSDSLFGNDVPDHRGQSSGMGSAPANRALRALHHGLIIYFYRRIYDVDANILQHQVVQVRDSLFTYKQHMQFNNNYLTGLVWPAFVAACEAVDLDLQNSFLEWFQICASRNGQASLARMQTFVRNVWAQRLHSQGASPTWLQLLRSNADSL